MNTQSGEGPTKKKMRWLKKTLFWIGGIIIFFIVLGVLLPPSKEQRTNDNANTATDIPEQNTGNENAATPTNAETTIVNQAEGAGGGVTKITDEQQREAAIAKVTGIIDTAYLKRLGSTVEPVDVYQNPKGNGVIVWMGQGFVYLVDGDSVYSVTGDAEILLQEGKTIPQAPNVTFADLSAIQEARSTNLTAVPTVETRQQSIQIAIEKAIGATTNTKNTRVRLVKVLADASSVRIEINGDENVTSSMTRDGLNNDTLKAYQAAFASDSTEDLTISIDAYLPGTDTYGNTSGSIAIQSRLNRATADKIQWGNVLLENIPGVLDYYHEVMKFD